MEANRGVEGRQGQLARIGLEKKLKEHFWHVKGLQALISCCWSPEAFRETGLYRQSLFSL